MQPQRGEIYYAEFPEGRRPVLVLSRSSLNRGGNVVVVPFTSTRFHERSRYPNCVPFHAGEFGLGKDCVAQGEGVTICDLLFLDPSGPIGALPEERMRSVVRAIGYMMDAECELSTDPS